MGESVTVRIVPLPLSISNAYLLLGDRPSWLMLASRVKRTSCSMLHRHGIAV